MKDNTSWALYKRLLKYVRPFWKAFVVALIGNAIYAGSSTLMARIMEYLTNGIQNPDADFRMVMPLLLIGIFIARGIGTFLGSYGMEYVARNVVHRLRVEVFDRLLHLPGRFFDQHSSGHLISRVTYHVEQVTGAATKALNVILQEGMLVVGLTIYLFWTNWKLMLVFMAVTPLIGGVVSYASRRFRRLSRRIQRSVGDVTHVASEAISGYRVVRMHGAQAYEYQRFHRASDYNRRQSLKEALTKAISAPVIQTLVAVSLAVLVWLALAPDLLGDMNAGEFVGFLTAASMMIKPIKSLTDINGLIQKGLAASQELFGLLDREPEPDHGDTDPGRVEGRVRMSGVGFRYGAELPEVLQDINLEVEPGEMVALVGRSGSGKTTLVNLLPRFYDITQGAITLDEIPLESFDLKALRRQIALVNQQVTLFNATVAENIAYGIDSPDPEAVRAAAEAAYAEEFIERLPHGYDTVVGDNGVMLSGGQRQRIAIARAIFRDAPLLILDEATSALDTESERYIQQALERVCQGRTTFVIAHRLSTIERADRILVMDQGRIIEQGSHQQLLDQDGAYAALYRVQFQEEPSRTDELT
ncbi:lipid A export permease/ATP-binding protein MsbA [Kushneria sinocarnis]|uniref:Lipid A export permease/ATP-binding protein MsbA n=1 Tax=Kushneria sinocarnis TaxID=595502 RepID=A0A420WYW0_9GAMM|nr:lipid A export permease/ATP-binding protein MsbA [Kushneria sinocarnis]RKR06366.1 lipid A export permease/ATP-binding protein MsbA [Kushneria sinocarnis]